MDEDSKEDVLGRVPSGGIAKKIKDTGHRGAGGELRSVTLNVWTRDPRVEMTEVVEHR